MDMCPVNENAFTMERSDTRLTQGCRVLALALLCSLTGCGLLHGCDTVLLPGIRVFVLDSITGATLPVDDVTVVMVDGAYADTAQVELDGPSYYAVYDRAGVYRVRVTAPKYSTWVRENVAVQGAGGCRPTKELTARMQTSTSNE
jgi:hypothetical protein